MAFTKRTIRRVIVIRFDENGAFTEAFQDGEVQALEDGTVFAKRELAAQFMTLAQAKTLVAGL